MKEDNVSFEVAKLLKEKGFNESVWLVFYEELPLSLHTAFTKNKENVIDLFYTTKDTEIPSLFSNNDEIPKYINTNVYAAPTLQMAMKWLREIHRLFIEISVNINLDDKYYYYSAIYDKDMNIKKSPVENKYDTYEEAAMDAINYCLTRLL